MFFDVFSLIPETSVLSPKGNCRKEVETVASVFLDNSLSFYTNIAIELIHSLFICPLIAINYTSTCFSAHPEPFCIAWTSQRSAFSALPPSTRKPEKRPQQLALPPRSSVPSDFTRYKFSQEAS